MVKKLMCLVLGVGMLWVAVPCDAAGSLVAHWAFDGNGQDTSGNKNNATAYGGVGYGAGMSGQAIQFDNRGEYLQVANNPGMQLLSGKGFTVAAYVNAASTNQGNILIHGLGCSTWASWFLGMQGGEPDAPLSANSFVFGVRLSGGAAYTGVTATAVTGEWVYVAATHDGTTMKMFLNGQETDSAAAPLPFNSTESLYMGGDPGCGGRSWFTGLVDDVYIFNRGMSASQIGDLANGILPAWLKAEDPKPADGAIQVIMPLLQWSKGDTALLHNVYLGTSPELAAADLVGPRWPTTQFYYVKGLTPGTTYYWRVDEVDKDGVTIYPGDVWKFTVAPVTAYAPNPRNGDKWIATDTALTWQPGQGAMQHEVYFSTDKDAVVNRDASAFQVKQPAPTYTPGALSLSTTYYWAVDEVTVSGKNVGELWKFTTVGAFAGGVKGEYYTSMTPAGSPQMTRIDPSINFNWGTEGPGAPIGTDGFSARWTADLEIVIADNYTFISTSDDGVRVWLDDDLVIDNWTDHGPTDNPTRPIALDPGVYSLRMEFYENTGGAVAQLFWQSPNFARQIIPAGPLQPPVRARALYPQSGDANIPQDVTLMWGAGEKAVKHHVYFGDDADAVAAADTSSSLYRGEQALDATTFKPGLLEWNKTYYWRIDEVNDASADSPWIGTVWSFTTADFLVVDNMETYNDEEGTGTRIYETWIDGYTDGLSGSTVGNLDPPFAEQTIVHGGRQSMPMDYNNVNSPFYSQAYREFSPLQNWTVNGVSDLVLWVRGYPASMAPVAESGGKMTVSGEGSDIWNNSDQFTFVYKTLSGDGSLIARVVSNGSGSNTWTKGGVMIRDSLAAGSVHGMMVMTGGAGNGASFQYRAETDGGSANSDAAAVLALPYYVKIERTGDTIAASLSADGKTWTQQGESQYLAMTAPAYLGICVTSHVPGEYRTFEFDNVKATGASGAWQTTEIGLARNSQQPLYVIVEDSAGKKAAVVDPNVAAVDATTWTEWKIPLTDLAGVNLMKVKKLTIGVGDTANPAPDGYGRIYIDDICVVKPAE